MKKECYSYGIVWIDKSKKQINDCVDHYSKDEALEVIYKDNDWSNKHSKILWTGKYPLTKKQMQERKRLTGIEIT